MFRFFTVTLILVWLSHGSCQETPAAFTISTNPLESPQLNGTNPLELTDLNGTIPLENPTLNNATPLEGSQLNGTNPSEIPDLSDTISLELSTLNSATPLEGSQLNGTNPSDIPDLNDTISLEFFTLNETTPDVLDLNDTNRLEPQQLNDAFILNTISTNQTNDRNPIGDWIIGIIGRPTTEATVQLDPPEKCDECSCGIANKQKRIVGGHETEVNQYPWMALLTYGGRFYCGASLISDRYVLTAAHCVSGFNKDRIGVTLLEHNRSTSNESQTIRRKIQRIVRHAGYSPTNFNNDIALLRMDKEVKFTNLLKPVCLPTRGKSFSHYDGIATGWGAVQSQGDISSTLQEVTVPILSNYECRKTGYGSTRITDNMICAGFKDGQKDSCQGDSGGPLHIKNDTIYHVVGIVSWGEGCAEANYPGVYTRVNRYRTWIKSNTKDACFCGEQN